ncbi:MAG: YihY/virulence factor BrkB family protein [Anaerolineae bacterium]|nr:YihY/virulence factor BrkB family protein [Anaerolineae bacterium]
MAPVFLRSWTKKYRQTVQKSYRRLNRISNGGIEILVNCLQSFGETRASMAAASLGYYTIFSLFPLLLVMIIVASFFVDQSQVQILVTDWVMQFIPFASDFILANIIFVFENSNVAGVIAVVGLLWSATTVFYMLVYNINLPWSRRAAAQPFKNRIAALAIIGVLLGLLVLSTTLTTVVNLINSLLPFLNLLQTPLWNWLLALLPFLLRFLVYFSLYRWVPNVPVRGRSAVIVAFFAMWALEATSRGFKWMLQNGLVRYQVVYGTLGSIMTLMFWVYINFVVILFCAHLTAAIEAYTDSRLRGRENLKLPEYRYHLAGITDEKSQGQSQTH